MTDLRVRVGAAVLAVLATCVAPAAQAAPTPAPKPKPAASAPASTPAPATPAAVPSTPAPGPALVYMGDVRAAHRMTLNPFAGKTTITFTVRNAGVAPLSGLATLWQTNAFGATIGEPVVVEVRDLGVGESRNVEAHVHGLGQWGFGVAHAVFTPPSKVGDTTLAPMTREHLTFAAPWLWLVLIVGAGLGYRSMRRASRRSHERTQA